MYTTKFDKSLTTQFYESIEAQRRDLEKEHEGVRDMAAIFQTLQGLPSFSHVQTVCASTYGYKFISLSLRRESPDSPLVREITQAFHAKGTKQADEGGMGLQVTWNIQDGAGETVHITVERYLPNSCRIVEEDKYVPAQWTKVKRVQCGEGDGEGDTAADTADVAF